MDLRTPMQLYRDQEHVGLITRYGYETPWATGIDEDFDPDRGERSDRVAQFLQWMARNEEDLPEDDRDYDEICSVEMARLGVTQADVDWCERGSWTIQTQDGIDHKVYSLDFIDERTIQWRW
jgi:hypothetical protein